MDVLWDRGAPATVRDVSDALHDRGLAYTTVMTVLDRLAGKGMVERERTGRAWSYRPAAPREAYIARLMLDALDLAPSKDAALVRFAHSVSGTDADVLRAALADGPTDGPPDSPTAGLPDDPTDGPTGAPGGADSPER